MPYGLYGFGAPDPAAPDEGADLVSQLLSSLEMNPTPQQPKIGVARGILGALGDAITAASRVRAGGQAPAIGAFTGNLLQQRQNYEQQAQAVAASNRDLRNRIRIGQFQQAQEDKARAKAADAEAAARIAAAQAKADAQVAPPKYEKSDITVRQEDVDKWGFPADMIGKAATVLDIYTPEGRQRQFIGPVPAKQFAPRVGQRYIRDEQGIYDVQEKKYLTRNDPRFPAYVRAKTSYLASIDPIRKITMDPKDLEAEADQFAADTVASGMNLPPLPGQPPTSGAARPTAEQRYNQLKAQGNLSEDEIYAKLKEEGYKQGD